MGAILSAVTGINTPWVPSQSGYLAWNADPASPTNNQNPTAGIISLARVDVRQAVVCTGVTIYIVAAGATLTAGQNFAGLYNSAGTLVGTSADQTTAWGATNTATLAANLAGGPFPLPAGFYWVAVLSNGTTPPTLSKLAGGSTSNGANLGLTAAQSRWGSVGSALTALPASITPASITAGNFTFWAGIF